MSSSTSRKKRSSAKEHKMPSIEANVREEVKSAAPSSLPSQAISWPEVARQLVGKRRRWSQVWDWSKPNLSPLTWYVSVDENSELLPWLKALAVAWSDPTASEKQSRRIEKMLEHWTIHAPLRLQRLLAPSDATDNNDLRRDARLFGLESVAIAWLFPALAEQISSELCESTLAVLLEMSDAQKLPSDCEVCAGLWQMELPLTLSAWLPGEIFPSSLQIQALDLLKAQIEELTDGNGLIVHDQVSNFGALLAGWTRIWRLEKFIADLMAGAPLRDRFRYAFQQHLRMLGHDGSPLLSVAKPVSIPTAMVSTWLQLGQDAEERRIAELTCPSGTDFSSIKGPRLKDSRLSDAADYSAWGRVAVLRSRWKRKSDKLAVAFGQAGMQIELNVKRSWLAGTIATQIHDNGQPLSLGERWEEICWQSDEDMIYLELQNELSDNRGLLQRQVAIARKDRLCLIADAVLLEPTAAREGTHRLAHRWTLPLASGIRFEAAAETREGWLTDGKNRLSFLPVSMPEWRVQHSHGRLEPSETAIGMTFELPASRLFQAVLIDLDARRSSKPLSWSPLTVGENLQKVPVDQAMAVRVQLNREQFLMYRSLTAPASRTFVGQNVYADFYWGRFQPNGTAESMIMIESA
jgi:hypothetical protein